MGAGNSTITVLVIVTLNLLDQRLKTLTLRTAPSPGPLKGGGPQMLARTAHVIFTLAEAVQKLGKVATLSESGGTQALVGI